MPPPVSDPRVEGNASVRWEGVTLLSSVVRTLYPVHRASVSVEILWSCFDRDIASSDLRGGARINALGTVGTSPLATWQT